MTLFISGTLVINNSIGFNSFSTLLLVLSQKLGQNSITLLLIWEITSLAQRWYATSYNTKFFHQLTNHFSTTNLPPFLDLLTIQPTRFTRSSAVVTLQRPPNPSRLKISDNLSTFKRPNFGMLYHIIFARRHSTFF